MKTLFNHRIYSSLVAACCFAMPLHAADLTWDADTITVGIQDGANVWDTTTNTWWDGAANVVWTNATPDNAVFGTVGSGTAGPVTVGAGLTINVGNLTFNPPNLGNYNLTPGDASSRLSFTPSSIITVASGLTVTNTVVLTGTSSFTKSGPGTLSLRPAIANLNSGLTLVKAGTLVMGSSGGRVVIPGDLIVTNTGTARLGAANTVTNIATVSLAAGATFEMNGNALSVANFVLNGGTVTQTSTEALTNSTLDARSGSILQSGGTGKLDVGTLTKSTPGTVVLTGRASSTTTAGITNAIINDGTLVLDYTQTSKKFNTVANLTMNGGTLLFTNFTANEAVGTFVLNGGTVTNASGNAIDIRLGTGGNFDVRTGSVYMVLGSGSGQRLIKSTPGVVILAADNTYSGGTLINDGILQLGDGGAAGLSGSVSAAITNNAKLVFNRSGALVNISGTISGTGSIVKMGSGYVGLTDSANSYSGSTTISNGVINISSTSKLGDGTGALNMSGGTLNTTASRTASSAPVGNPLFVNADSAITTTNPSATVDLNFTNDSISGVAGTLTFRNDAASGTGIFVPRFSGSGFNFARPIVIANGSFGTTRVDSYNTTGTTQTFSGVISGSGGYRRNASTAGTGGTTVFGGNNTYTGATDVNRGVLLVNGSLASSNVTVNSTGTLGGNGTVNGPVTVQSGGTVSAGTSIGILNISNSLTFLANSTNYAEIRKSPMTNDLVRGITTVTYAGTLTVANLSGTLALNDTFKIFDATTYTGSFSATNLPALDPGLAWDTTGLTSNGTIKVVAAAAGSPTLTFTQTGSNLQFSWTGSFKLQSQTNSLSTGLGANWADFPGGGSSPVNVTADPANPSVFFRLISTP